MDPIGIWFEEIGKFYGERIEIPFCRYDMRTGETEWFRLPHSEHDGFSGYAHLLGERGYDPATFPDMRNAREPGFFMRLRSIVRLIYGECEETEVSWIRLDGQLPGKSPGVAWHIFDRDETARFERFCLSRGGSYNSLLLMALTRSVPRFFRTESVRGNGQMGDTWMLPVSMRKKGIADSRAQGNRSSYTEVILDDTMEMGAVHAAVKSAFAENKHHAAWFLLRLSARLASRRRLARFIAGKMATAKGNTGCFSNLGRWDPRSEDAYRNEHEIWFGVPPVAPGQPIGAGAMVWKGRLVLSLQVHPSVAPDFARVQSAFDSWISSIRAECS